MTPPVGKRLQAFGEGAFFFDAVERPVGVEHAKGFVEAMVGCRERVARNGDKAAKHVE